MDAKKYLKGWKKEEARKKTKNYGFCYNFFRDFDYNLQNLYNSHHNLQDCGKNLTFCDNFFLFCQKW